MAPDTPEAAPGGAARIHDIGYRGYQGPRLGRGYARRALAAHSLRGVFGLGRSGRAKVLPFALVGMVLLPVVALVLVAITVGLDRLPVEYTEFTVETQQITTVFLALAAPQLVSLDQRYRVTPLYFSRPLSRADYVAAKLAALTGAVLLFLAVPLAVLCVGALLGELDAVAQLTGFLQGLVGAAVLATLFAAVALLIASVTPRRGFGVAAVIAVFTLSYVAVHTLQEIVGRGGDTDAVVWLGLLSPGSLVDGFQSALLGSPGSFPGGVTPGVGAGVVYLLVIAAVTALSVLLTLRRYRKAGI